MDRETFEKERKDVIIKKKNHLQANHQILEKDE